MLYMELKKWHALNPDKRCVLIFHTSVLLFPEEELRMIARDLPYQWMLPRNVYYEIDLLRASSEFGKKAAGFLELFRKEKGAVLCQNLEDFYDSRARIQPAVIWGVSKLFIFGSQIKMKEFLERVPVKNDYLIFYHNRWTFQDFHSNDMIAAASQARQWIGTLDYVRKQKHMGDAGRNSVVKNIKEVEARGRNLKFRTRYCVGRRVESGGESDIYEAVGNSSILLKIYRYPVSPNRLNKLLVLLEVMEQGGWDKRTSPVKFPLSILYAGDVPVGISIRRVSGDSLLERITDIDLDPVSVLEDLALCLLELNLLQIVVADLAEPNLMLDGGNRLYLVDADSFQFRYYDSGIYIRDQYMHRELVGKTGGLLYDFRYQDFSFAVLAFKLLVCGTFSPLYQAGAHEASEKLLWGGKFKFPYALPGEKGQKINETCRKCWEKLPLILRRAFAEEFRFQREHSIGSWLYLLEEAQK